MRDWVFDFWIPTLVLVVILGAIGMIAYAVYNQQVGYEMWISKLDLQNGALLCEDRTQQVVVFKK